MLTADVIRGKRALDDLREPWTRLLGASRSDSLFLTWEWIRTWWDVFGDGTRSLHLVAVREPGGELVGLALLHVHRVNLGGGIRLRRMGFLGTGEDEIDEVCSEYLGIIARAGAEGPVAVAVAGHLAATAGREWDELALMGLAAGDEATKRLAEALAGAGLAVSRRSHGQSIYIPLEGSATDMVAQISPDLHWRVRRSLRRLDKMGSWRIWVPESSVETAAAMRILDDLHRRRWRSRGKPGAFASPRFRHFHDEFAEIARRQAWLYLAILFLGDRPLGAIYNFVYGSRMYYYQSGIDTTVSNAISAGHVLHWFACQECVKRDLAEYDFLRGKPTSYKGAWGGRARPLVSLVVGPVGLRGACLGGVRAAARAIRYARRRVRGAGGMRIRMKSVRRVLGRPVRVAAHIADWMAEPRGNGLAILAYHRVLEKFEAGTFPFDPGVVSALADDFRAQMTFLKEHFDVLRFADLEDWMTGSRDRRRPAALVTFDDGYRDNYEVVYPILRELGIPGTFFIATGYIGTGEVFWWDQVVYHVRHATRSSLLVPGRPPVSLPLGTPAERRRTAECLLTLLKRMQDAERRRVVAALAEMTGATLDPAKGSALTMRWDEIQRMHRDGMEFGSHTVTHPVLARLPVEGLQAEIGGSKRALEEHLGAPVVVLSYPVGGADSFTDTVKEVARRNGYRFGTTYRDGLNPVNPRDLFTLRRIPVERDTTQDALARRLRRLTEGRA